MPISLDENERFVEFLKEVSVREVELDRFDKHLVLRVHVEYPFVDDVGNERTYINIWQFTFDKLTNKLTAEEVVSEQKNPSTEEVDSATLDALRGELRMLRALAAFYINHLGY